MKKYRAPKILRRIQKGQQARKMMGRTKSRMNKSRKGGRY